MGEGGRGGGEEGGRGSHSLCFVCLIGWVWDGSGWTRICIYIYIARPSGCGISMHLYVRNKPVQPQQRVIIHDHTDRQTDTNRPIVFPLSCIENNLGRLRRAVDKSPVYVRACVCACRRVMDGDAVCGREGLLAGPYGVGGEWGGFEGEMCE